MRFQTAHRRNKERGNILFLILLAVVLFAALSYAVTSSMRGGGKDMSAENVQMGTAAMLQWFGAVDAAVLRMNLSDDIRFEDISFGYDTRTLVTQTPTLNYAHNARCTTDRCRVFKPDGGGVAPPEFSRYANTNPSGAVDSTIYSGQAAFYMMQWPDAGTSKNDVMVGLWNILPSVCQEINKSQGITAQPVYTGPSLQAHTPANWDNAAYTISANAAQLSGKSTFATTIWGSGNGQSCFVWHLLIAR